MPTMTTQRAAELQVLLEGVALPAQKQELVDYARRYDPGAAAQLAALPDREYARLDDVGEELAPTEPQRPSRVPALRPESGKPPGGHDYLDPSPEPGAVRPSAPAGDPPQSALQQQTKIQKRQKHVQKGTPRQKAQKKAEEEAG
jgi:hypothetical protein